MFGVYHYIAIVYHYMIICTTIYIYTQSRCVYIYVYIYIYIGIISYPHSGLVNLGCIPTIFGSSGIIAMVFCFFPICHPHRITRHGWYKQTQNRSAKRKLVTKAKLNMIEFTTLKLNHQARNL